MASRRADSSLSPPYDLEARYSEKRGKGWTGYKARISETCCEPEPDGTREAPNLITSVATTEATVPDAAMTGPVHDRMAAAGLLPAEHAVDAGYTSADLLLDARARGITLLGPLLSGSPPQARSGGYTAEAFTIDWDRQQVTCPQGVTSTGWSQVVQQEKRQAIVVRFATAACRACPARARCTTSRTGRQLFLRPREIHEAVAAAQAGQSTQHWKHRYNIRAGVEGTMRQATHITGIRRARYLGLDKTRLEHNAAVAAVKPAPAGCLVDRQAPRPDPDHPPPAARPHRRRLSRNKPTGSDQR